MPLKMSFNAVQTITVTFDGYKLGKKKPAQGCAGFFNFSLNRLKKGLPPL